MAKPEHFTIIPPSNSCLHTSKDGELTTVQSVPLGLWMALNVGKSFLLVTLRASTSSSTWQSILYVKTILCSLQRCSTPGFTSHSFSLPRTFPSDRALVFWLRFACSGKSGYWSPGKIFPKYPAGPQIKFLTFSANSS